MARSTRHRLLAGLALAFAASGARAIDSEVHGAVVDVGVGTSIAGDAVLGDLGGAWSGLRSLANERWLLDWDLSLTFRAGYAANAIPGIFLLGGRMVACSELGYRTAPAGPWSPYVGLRIGGELSLVGHPGLPLSQVLSTYNDLYGLAGVNAAGSIGLGVGASLLDEVRSLRLELILQETLRAAGTYTPAYAFSEAGVGARYDTERSITLALEGLVVPRPAAPDSRSRIHRPGLALARAGLVPRHLRQRHVARRPRERRPHPGRGELLVRRVVLDRERADPLPHGLVRGPALRGKAMRRRRLLLLGALALLGPGCDAYLSPSTVGYAQRASWGFDAIDHMPTPPDPPTSGAASPFPRTTTPRRGRPAHGTGDRAATTLGLDEATAAAIPIRHVIILMKENRSFDHIFGKLHDRGAPDVEPVPASFMNPDTAGQPVDPFHATTTCTQFNPDHQTRAVAWCVDGGRMDGFVASAASSTGSDGTFVMGATWTSPTSRSRTGSHAPSRWATGTSRRSRSGTYPNRNFLLLGTNAGVVDTGIAFPPPSTPSILQLLIAAGYTWGVYTDGPLSAGP